MHQASAAEEAFAYTPPIEWHLSNTPISRFVSTGKTILTIII